MDGLGDLVAADLEVRRTLRQRIFLVAGRPVATLTLEKAPMFRVVDPAFRRRMVRLEVDGAELETRWRVEAGGREIGEAVHLFPYNLFTPRGFHPARGFELRDRAGVVVGYLDRREGAGRTSLVYRSGAGKARARCTARSLRRYLVLEGPDGAARLDLVRGTGQVAWRAPWVRSGLKAAEREAVGECLVLALLWAKG